MSILIASCNCNRRTGREDKMIKAPTPTKHVEDVCIYCGHYVVYLDSTREVDEQYKRKREGIDLQKDYLYNFGYPLGGRR